MTLSRYITIYLATIGMAIFPFTSSDSIESNQTESRILSRKKRFLTFPEGSSVQIVFETQNHGYLQIGDIVWFSNTASLAWDLPKDASLLRILKSGEKDIVPQRRGDNVRHIYYLDERGKLIDKVPYVKKFITPVFGKRSVDEKGINKDVIKRMHKKQIHRDYLKSTDLSESNIEFHRSARTDLYEKLEKYIQSLGWKGRNCILKMLCESGKDKNHQGSFLEEILRAVFTLPYGKQFDKVHHQLYDEAHNAPGVCEELYPGCSQSSGLPSHLI